MSEIKKERPKANIHTVSYRSEKEPHLFEIMDEEVFCNSPLPTKYGEIWSFKVNAEKAVDYVTKEKMFRFHPPRPDTLTGQDEALSRVLKECCCQAAELKRLDFKFDWKKTEYKDLERINRFLIACFSVSRSGEANTYETRSVMRKEVKGLKASTKHYEVEYYDKQEQAPITAKKSKTKARLEIRHKAIAGADKATNSMNPTIAIHQLINTLRRLKDFAQRVEEEQNKILLEYWEKEGYTLKRWTTFFAVHEPYFYTLRQAKSFLRNLGAENPEKAVSNFQRNKLKALGRPLLLKENEFEKYVDELSELLSDFYLSNVPVPDPDEEEEEKMIDFQF